MSEQPDTPVQPDDTPAAAGASTPPTVPGAAPAWTPPESAPPTGVAAVVADRPEVAVGAAFAGGFVLALILKRLAR